MSKRIVIAAIGSRGDLHPAVAIARELELRGHSTVVATTACYRTLIQGQGLGFHAIRPDLQIDETTVNKILSKQGTAAFVRDVLLANLAYTYDDLRVIAQGADLLLAGELVFAAPLVTEKYGIAWVSAVLSPSSLGSVYDQYPALSGNWGSYVARLLHLVLSEIGTMAMGSWLEPINQLRAKLGLAPSRNAFSSGRLSPRLVLGLFPSVIAQRRPDWPFQVKIVGAVFDRGRDTVGRLSPHLMRFLRDGEPPLVFTLGSAAVMSPGTFYQESARAAQRLGRRAVLLFGNQQRFRWPSDQIAAFGYEPYAALFPRAAAVIQAAGAGGIAEALRAGRPMLLLPYGYFDQPSNARRLARLGLARTILPHRYTAERAAFEISELLLKPAYREKADQARHRVEAEDGLSTACDEIERCLANRACVCCA